MSETVSTFFESGLLLKPLKKSLVALQEVCWKKKQFICYLQDNTVYTLIYQFSYPFWSNPGNGTWDLPTLQSSTLPLNQSSSGSTCIEPKFNSATKARIGCMTLWMTSWHFMKRSSCTKFNWFELCSRPQLDSTIHYINHHLVDKCKGNQWHYLVNSDLSDG